MKIPYKVPVHKNISLMGGENTKSWL